jgi:hypothetical protein
MPDSTLISPPETTLHPAQTRAAQLPLSPKDSARAVRNRITTLVDRGYNTLLVPVMADGDWLTMPAGDAQRAGWRGPAAVALDFLAQIPSVSVWVYADPFLAGPRGSGHLSPFAREHRSWLMRNTQGRTRPLGIRGNEPLFSWLNPDYRRFVGDRLLALAMDFAFTGVVIDGRGYPGISHNPDRWYCCSFQSQQRAEKITGLRFDDLLSRGSQEQINIWRAWTVKELRAFIQNLKARMIPFRADLCWKALLMSDPRIPPYESPFIGCFAEGLVSELLIVCDPGQSPSVVQSEVDRFLHQKRLILPAYVSEQGLADHREDFADLPVPGFIVLEPESRSTSNHGELPAPEVTTSWPHEYALEDNPLAAVAALADSIHQTLGDDHKVGRFFRRFADYLVADDRTAQDIDHMLRSVRAIEERQAAGESEFEVGDNPSIRRDIALIPRLLTGMEIPVRV